MEKRHRIRLMNSLVAAGGGVVLSLVVIYTFFTGELHLSASVLISALVFFWAVNFAFILAVGSGWSDRFKDGSLTLPQMYWASVSCLASMMVVHGHYEFILLLLFVIMVFGVFRMSGSQFITYASFVVFGLGVQQYVSHQLPREEMDVTHRVFLWVVFSMCAVLLATMCQSICKMRERLREKNNALGVALNTKNIFLANMSHEIRTPINGVIGMLRLMLRSELSEKQRHQSNMALTSAQSLLAIVNDIFDFSRIEAGHLELERVDFDLCQKLESLCQTFSERAEEKGLEFIVDTSGLNQPWVKGDASRIHQILMHVLDNALKFTRQGEIVVCAELVDVSTEVRELRCRVKDTGIGIPPEQLEEIFQPFSQVDLSTTRKFGGVGLGLTLVRRLCQLMDGDISIESVVGYGSDVVFTVRVAACEQHGGSLDAPLDLDGEYMLVVAENLSANNVLAKQLRAKGAKVHQAYDANAGISKIYQSLNSEFHPLYSWVFIDADIRADDGISLVRTIKHDSDLESMKVALLSRGAKDSEDPREKVDVVLGKPLLSTELLEMFSPKDNASASSAGATVSPDQADVLGEGEVQPAREASSSSTSSAHLPVKEERVGILLVEDNLVNRKVAEGLLEQFGLSCDCAENGTEAIKMLLHSVDHGPRYQLVLMDCQMPVMDGYEATRQIRAGAASECYATIPIVAVTANALDGDRERCLNAGMNDYLTKPLDINLLAGKINQWGGQVKFKSNVVDFVKAGVKDKHIPVWNEDAALKRAGGKSERLVYLVRLFLRSLPDEVEKLHRAVESLDLEVARVSAISVKGVAGDIGALKLMESAVVLESLSRQGKVDALKEHMTGFADVYLETCRTLEQYDAKHVSTP